MAKTRTSGIKFENGIRIIDKIFKGERIYIRLGEVSQEEAELRLAEEIRERKFKRLSRKDTCALFADGAARYLIESKDKDSLDTIATHINSLLPFIGTLPLDMIHDGTLEEFKEARREEEVSPTTINRALEVVCTILTRAARAWRDEYGKPLLLIAPPLLKKETENRRPPHPLSWDEQDYFIPELPPHLQTMSLFGINTGLRDDNICGLRWDWEVPLPLVGRSVFIVHKGEFKTDVEHVLILNDAAWSIIESQRAIRNQRLKDAGITNYTTNPKQPTEFDYVFTYEGHRIGRMNNSSWRKARLRAAMALYTKGGKIIPEELLKKGQRGILISEELRDFMRDVMPGFANLRAHDLRHTYASRLRLAAVNQEDRNALLGHKSASIPELYASGDVGRLIKLSNLVLDRQGTCTLLRVVNG